MTARVNIVINYDKNRVEVFKFNEGSTEKEDLFASTAMSMIESLNLRDTDIPIQLDLGATLEFKENEDSVDDDVMISVLENGRNKVVGGHQSLTYILASSVLKEMKNKFDTYGEDYDEDYDEDLIF